MTPIKFRLDSGTRAVTKTVCLRAYQDAYHCQYQLLMPGVFLTTVHCNTKKSSSCVCAAKNLREERVMLERKECN